MRTRQIEFDIARGIGVAAVVFCHNGGILLGSSFIVPYYIALFFVIAGYFYKDNSVKRAKKLGAIYCQYTFFLFVISFIMQSGRWMHNLFGALYGRYCFYTYDEKPNIIFLTMENHPLWFLLALCLTTLLFGGLMPKLYTVKQKVIALIVLVFISWGFTFLPILLPWSLDTISTFVVFMLAGYWMKQYSAFSKFYHFRFKYIIFGILSISYILLKKMNRGINVAVREYGRSIGGGQNGLLKWEEEHPGEKYPMDWNLSLDYAIGECEDGDVGKSSVLAGASYDPFEDEPDDVLRLREIVAEKMTDRQRQAYQLIGLEGCSKTEAAEIMGVSVKVAKVHYDKAIECIRKNF